MGFDSYFHNRPTSTSSRDRQAYLRVRVSDDVTPSGYVAVYLATGTQILVPTRELLRYHAHDVNADIDSDASPDRDDPPHDGDVTDPSAIRSRIVFGA
jgi:hypothetical protein